MAERQQISGNLSDELANVLRDDNTPQSVINEVLSSMALTQSRDMAALIEATRQQDRKLDDIIARLGRMSGDITSLADVDDRLCGVEAYLADNPPLLWLLRYRTKQTLALIGLVFVLLSLIYVSDLRQPFLAALGLPVF